MLHINVNDHTEKKGQLTYLSWPWAWTEALRADPEATWEVVEYAQPDGTLAPCMYLQNRTALVKTRVTLKGVTKVCVLPVMDHRNKAIVNPGAFEVNTAAMRCMTKTLAMFGLGLYIYSGEDLPPGGPESAEDVAAREAKELRQSELEEFALHLIDLHKNEKDIRAIELWYGPEMWSQDHATAQDEKLAVWEMLRGESRLRSTIKANKPEVASSDS